MGFVALSTVLIMNYHQVFDSSKSISSFLGCKYFVNACGPHAAKIALMAGIGSGTNPNPMMQVELPVRPKKRIVFVLSCPNGPKEMPMLIDSSGFYIKSETQKSTYICGISPNEVIQNALYVKIMNRSFFFFCRMKTLMQII